MKITKTDGGFIFESDHVKFDFLTDVIPIANGGLYDYTAKGNIPVPIIQRGDRLLLPVDEGIAITADRKYEDGEFDCENIQGRFCSREGTLSMVIVEREEKFLLIMLHEGAYGSYSARRVDGIYRLEMMTEMETIVSYGIFNKLSDACKCYRNAKNICPVTLREKRINNPKIEKLIGGAVFWLWNENYDKVMYSDKDTDISAAVGDELLKAADRMKDAGIDKALFGVFFNDDSKYVEELYEKYGYLATQYDNYSDVLNPKLLDIIPNNRVRACDYTRRRMSDYPVGVRVKQDGTLCDAWALKGFDGKYYNLNHLCAKVAKERMMEEIPLILKEYPYYSGRFIDVLGGGIESCYSKTHPMTRKECIKVKSEALSFLGDIGLIAGTEDGFEDLIDSLVYTEGLHSPVYFRNKNSGRKHAHIYDSERAEHIRMQMLDPSCRVPLWQLVYHDAMIILPYWGDSTASSGKLLKQKILFACLYGCAPLYSCFINDFENSFDEIVSSYKKITEIHERIAELPMPDFEVLDKDYKLQRSVFDDIYEIIVNFSDEDRFYNGNMVGANDYYFGALR